jgi:CDP-diacylglycerol--glycerol-3-phosphate 3-phosphatidyltransferase
MSSNNSSRKVFNLPNFLTVFRILILPVCGWALFQGADNDLWRLIAWTLFFLTGLTDIVDGKIARSRNQVSNFGVLLDPIADKAMLATATIGSSMLGFLSWWVTVILLVREISVTILRFTRLKVEVIPASKGAKMKTAFQSFGVGFYILPLPEILHIPRDIFMAIAIYLTIKTGIEYFRQVRLNSKNS